jgi:heat shock protein HtpX
MESRSIRYNLLEITLMNRLKTTFLLGLLTALVMAAGYFVGGQQGALLGLVLSALMNFGTYWFSDKMVLGMYGAQEVAADEDPKLHRMVEELCAQAALPKPRIYRVAMGVPNAFATGRNPEHAAVAVTDEIVRILDEKELRAVLAHELGHVKNRDILVSSVAATLAGALSYIAQMAYFASAFGGGDDEEGGNPLGFLGDIVFFLLAPFMAMLIQMAVSRSREFGADAAGAKMSGTPLALASALKKLEAYSHAAPLEAEPKNEATAHLFIVNPFRASFIMSLFSTHPSTEDRVARLEKMAGM